MKKQITKKDSKSNAKAIKDTLNVSISAFKTNTTPPPFLLKALINLVF